MPRIPGEITNAVLDEANAYDETMAYAKTTMAIAKQQHSLLHGYLKETAGQQGEYWYSYAIAAALSYDIVSRLLIANQQVVNFTDDDIARHRRIANAIFDDPRWEDE